jgi:hypothetical protein
LLRTPFGLLGSYGASTSTSSITTLLTYVAVSQHSQDTARAIENEHCRICPSYRHCLAQSFEELLAKFRDSRRRETSQSLLLCCNSLLLSLPYAIRIDRLGLHFYGIFGRV